MARRRNVASKPIIVFRVGKAVNTMKEKTDETALRIPFPCDRAWFGKISEEIKFGKLSGPI